MKTIILHWTPDHNWKELSMMPYYIEDGICSGGMNDYHPWSYMDDKEAENLQKFDRFFIVSNSSTVPYSSAYSYIERMGLPLSPASGLIAGGFVRSVDKDDFSIDISISFVFLPGVVKTIGLEEFKECLPNINWDKTGETLLGPEDESKVLTLIKNWMTANKRMLANSPYTNIINRNVDNLITGKLLTISNPKDLE